MKKELLAYQGDLGIIDKEINYEREKFINRIINYKKRLAVSHKLLKEKSDELAKLKADYQLINVNFFNIIYYHLLFILNYNNC